MKFTISVFIVLFATALHSQDLSEYRKETFTTNKGSLYYRILYPASFDSIASYPLLVFLHGAFEKGNDNEAQLRIGGRYFLREENRKNFPAIIIFPQCPLDDSWAFFNTGIDSLTGLASSWDFPFRKQPTPVTGLLKQLLDSLLSMHFIDKSRVYIGGLSQGGMGVYDMVARYPDVFAAAFPICGAGKTGTCKQFAGKIALWIFHGSDDEIVPTYFSRDFYKRLSQLNADVKYSEYPGVHHNSWVNAFAEKDLLSWLFSKSKKQ
ncbi:MAG TPA: PHB depolymerase family esterase [Chitinophagaceae bacterium]|nr:PHB depolymerase family esterase [Chitinophagaceae bacterium]